jgi:hypothetical protein
MKQLLLVVTTFFILHSPFSSVCAAAPAPTPKTGQTVSAAAGDDGALQPGVASPSPRFVDNANGSVSDRLTGLTWLKDANCFGNQNWDTALLKANALAGGACGLSDGSEAGDWHLPNKNELWSLVDFGRSNPALPAGHPFTSVQSYGYWSSTSYANSTDDAWIVYMGYGAVYDYGKGGSYSVWPVRSGQFWSFGSLILSSSTATDFGTIPIGRASAASQVRIRNSGAAAASFSALISGADASHFTTVPGGTAPCASLTPTLDAGAACTLLVTATPTNSGPKSANLSINSAGTSKDIPLTATAYSTLLGTITDMSNGLPVAGASVALTGGAAVSSDSSGAFNFGPSITAGSYSITASKSGYQNVTVSSLTVSTTQNGSASILLPTSGPLNITSTVLPSATAATAYSSRVMVAGGTAPYTFNTAYGSLPSGLTLDSAYGFITGTPTGSGSSTFGIRVTDTAGAFSEQEYTIDLTATLAVATATLARATSASSYPATVTASGGKAPYSFSVTSGALPTGLTLTTGGSFSGTVTATGDFPLTITVSDASGRTASKNLIVSVDSPLLITTTKLDVARQGLAYSFTPTATGGYGAKSWSLYAGILPAGLTLDPATGSISGTPTEVANRVITLLLTDSYSRTAFANFPLTVTVPLGFSGTALPNAPLNSLYSEKVAVIGGMPPYSYSMSGILPVGLAFDSTTGTVSGTGTSGSTKNITITASDSSYPIAQSVTQNFSIKVTSLLTPTTAALLTNAKKGVAITPVVFAASGGSVPYSWTHIGGALPTGVTFVPSSATLSAGYSRNVSANWADVHISCDKAPYQCTCDA